MTEKPWICTNFEHNFGIQSIVYATTALKAKASATDPTYGTPHMIREATSEDIKWHRAMGGILVDEPLKPIRTE